MIKDKYLQIIKEVIVPYAKRKDQKFFLFGSSLKKEIFGDLDLGAIGITDKEIKELKEQFEESTFPYFVDVINFDKVDKKFYDNVFVDKILWLKP